MVEKYQHPTFRRCWVFSPQPLRLAGINRLLCNVIWENATVVGENTNNGKLGKYP
jgi:hypothetical protein